MIFFLLFSYALGWQLSDYGFEIRIYRQNPQSLSCQPNKIHWTVYRSYESLYTYIYFVLLFCVMMSVCVRARARGRSVYCLLFYTYVAAVYRFTVINMEVQRTYLLWFRISNKCNLLHTAQFLVWYIWSCVEHSEVVAIKIMRVNVT